MRNSSTGSFARKIVSVLLAVSMVWGSGVGTVLTAYAASKPTESNIETQASKETSTSESEVKPQDTASQEETQSAPARKMLGASLFAPMAITADPSWTPGSGEALVMNDAEFSAAIQNVSITKIFFGANIQMNPSSDTRYRIPAAKTNLIIDGTDPRTGTRYELFYPNSHATDHYYNINYYATNNTPKNFELRNMDIRNYNYYGILITNPDTNYCTLTFNSVHYEGTQLTHALSSKLVFKSDDPDQVNYFDVSNLPGASTALQEVAECAAIEFQAGKTEIHHRSVNNSTLWYGQRTGASVPGEFKIDTGADVLFDTQTSLSNNRGTFYIDGYTNSNVQFPIVVEDNARLEMLIGGCLCYSTAQQQAIRGMQIGKNSEVLITQKPGSTSGSTATVSLNGDLTVGKDSRVVITNRFTAGNALLFRNATNKVIVDNPRSFIIKNNGNNLINYASTPSGTGQFQVTGAGVHYYNTYYDTSDRSQVPQYFWEISSGAIPISISANLNSSGAPTGVTSNYTGPLASPSTSTFNPSTARIISVGPIDVSYSGGPITTKTTSVSGTATPGSDVAIDFKVNGGSTTSFTGVADANGNWTIAIPNNPAGANVPAGAAVSVSANLDYRTRTKDNVIDPVIDLQYKVNYYKGSVSTANLLGSSTAVSNTTVDQSITLADGTGNAQLNQFRPSGYQDGVQQGGAHAMTLTPNPNTIDVVYAPKTDLSYTVEYYKNDLTPASKIGTSAAITSQTGGEPGITLAAGAANGQLNAMRPSGYSDGVQQSPVPHVLGDSGNVIKVLYTKRVDLSYTVEYYRNDLTPANKIGTSTAVTNQTAETQVTLASGTENAQLDAMKPAGFNSGVQQSPVPYVIGDNPNVIKVLYTAPNDLSYTVKYYKGASLLSADYIGTSSPVTGQTGGSQITLAAGVGNAQLNAMRPSGYLDGVQQDAPHTMVIGTNEIIVLYSPKVDLSYTIKYYKGSVSDSNEIAASATAVTNQTGGSQITLATLQLDAFRPSGYQSGIQQAPVPYVVGDDPNVIKVVYSPKTDLSYTVEYYKDDLTPANKVGTSTAVTALTGGSQITLAAGTANAQLDAFKPAGYQSGIQQDAPYTMGDNPNVIKVLYSASTDLSYTVKYYKGFTLLSSTYVGASAPVTGVTGGSQITLAAGAGNAQLNAMRPSGFQNGAQQGSVPYTIVDGTNEITVLYVPKTDLSYTVEYYKDIASDPSDTTHYLGTSTTVTSQVGGTEITLASGTGNAQLDAYLPVGYLTGTQLVKPYVMGDNPNVIKVYYTAATSLSYTVRYYKGSVTNPLDVAHYLGESSPVTGVTGGSQITLIGGQGNAQLNMLRPSGYADGSQQNAPYTITTGDNVINVLYTARTDLTYKVEYYKDSVTSPLDTAHYLGSSGFVTDQTGDSQIYLASGAANAQLDSLKPAGYSSGIQQAPVPYIMGDNPNVIKVLYTAQTGLSYTVRYYKGSVTNPTDTDHFLGESAPVTGVTGGSQITLGAGAFNAQLNMFRPGGFFDGVQQNAPYTVVEGANYINVLYTPRTDLSYTVQYYKDSVTDPTDTTHYLGTSAAVTSVTGGSSILLAAGTANTQLDSFRPSGYSSGVQQGGGAFIIGDDPNVIKVLYRPRTDLSYTVQYYKGDLTAGNMIGTSTAVTNQTGGLQIALSAGTGDGQLNFKRPSGFNDGVQQNAPFTLGDNPNVIKVLYTPKTNLTYTVEYYKDSLASPPVGTSSAVTSQVGGTPITLAGGSSNAQLDAFKPAGYASGVQQNAPHVMGDDPNVIKVLYTASTGLSYTVEYYKDDLTPTNKIGTSTAVTGLTGGSQVYLPGGTANAQLNAMRPSGYANGVQQGAPHTIIDGTNVIKVLYVSRTDLTYTIHYYKGSVSAANEIGGSATTVTNQTGGSQITLPTIQLNAYRPSGFQNGVQQGTLPYVVGDDPNVISVVYPPKTDLTYTVEYYHDSVSASNRIGTSSAVTSQVGGTQILIASGTGSAQLDAMKPSGYMSGVQQNAPYTMVDDPNVIKVLYMPKTNLSYTIEYYRDNLSGTPIATSALVPNQTAGTQVTLGAIDLAANRPSGYKTGVQVNAPHTIGEDPNVIKVLFMPRTDLSYTVEYYKDNLSGTPIGTSTVSNQTGGSKITLVAGTAAGQLNAFKPSGYVDGVQQNAPYTMVDDPNVIKVLYSAQTDLTYTVEYYKDDASNTANRIGTSSTVGGNTTGDQITLVAGTADGQLDFKRPRGYKAGIQQGTIPYTIVGGANVIKVLYKPRTDLTYTIRYYKNSVDSANEIATSATTIVGQTGGSQITIQPGTNNGQLDAFRPSGFKSGVQQGVVPYTIGDDPNVINVVYSARTDLSYKIEYYHDSVQASNKIAESAVVPNMTGGVAVPLATSVVNQYKPSGYLDGVQQGAVPYVMGDDPNVIRILYPPKTDLTYKVTYYKDSLTSTPIGTSSVVANQTGGSQISLAAGTADGQLNFKRPSGYRDGIQQGSVPYVMGDNPNEIKVLYTPRTDLTYTIEYYKGDLTPANKVGASAPVANQTGGSSVTLTAAQLSAYWEAGYQPGQQQSAPFIIGDDPNVIKVLYTAANDLSYTVEYYKDDTNNPVKKIGTSTAITGNSLGAQITLAAGAANGQLDAFRPTGYSNGVQYGSLPYTVVGGTNVIKVLYMPKTDLSYTVEYYKESVTSGNFITRSSAIPALGGSMVFLDSFTLNAYAPSGFLPGIQQGNVPFVMGDNPNVIQVVYPPKTNLSYTVHYYKDSVSAANEIAGSSATVFAQKGGSEITLSGNMLDNHRPSGYQAGVQQGAVPYIMKDEPNVINVLYMPRTDLTYTVKYYKGTIADSDEIPSSASSPIAALGGSSITLDLVARNAHRPAGFKDGFQVAPAPHVMVDGDNIVKVLYEPRTDLSYTIEYYKDDLATKIATSLPVTGQTGGTQVSLSAAQRDAYRPGGYTSGIQQNAPLIVGDPNSNIIKVLYTKDTALTYTIDYYKDNTNTENKLVGFTSPAGAVQAGSSFTVAAGTTDGQLDFKRPSGYKTGVQVNAPKIIGDNPNTIQVLYTPRTDLSYTIEYYKGADLASASLVGVSDPVVGQTGGASIALGSVALDAMRPSGFAPGVQQATLVIGDNPNVVKVLYKPLSNLEYMVAYYSEVDGTRTLLGYSSKVIGQIGGTEVTLDAAKLNAMRPAGYKNGVQVITPYVVGDNPNYIEVLYTPKSDLTYSIKYYKDAIVAGEELGIFTSTPANGGTKVKVAAGTAPGQLDAYKPLGYASGIADPAELILDDTNNVITVLYTDSTPPAFDVIGIKDGKEYDVTPDISVIIKAPDTADNTTTEITIDGEPYEPGKPLPPGDHEVVVKVTDEAGNTTEKTYTIKGDETGPEFEVDGIDKGASYDTLPEITVDIKAPDTADNTTTEITIDGKPYEPGEPLAPGAHVVEVTVTDEFGNETTKTIIINGPVADKSISVIRRGGLNRVETAVLAAQAAWKPGEAKAAVIAVDVNFPDALVAAPLAGIIDGPILLTETGKLTQTTRDAIKRLGIKKFYIVGGTGAVSTKTQRQLESLGTVKRLGGIDRYATAKLIADEVVRLGGSRAEAYLATGEEFADALSLSSFAARNHIPILLSTPDKIRPEVTQFISNVHPKELTIAGGSGAISTQVETSAQRLTPQVSRYGGIDRYMTSYVITTSLVNKYDIHPTLLAYASGANFPDALTAAPSVGKRNGVLALTLPEGFGNASQNLLSLYKDNLELIEIYGGYGAVSSGTEATIRQLAVKK